ncbi:MAG: hypothetical protein ACTSR1_00135 [Candidatus Heimdallarchaeota archaeon]
MIKINKKNLLSIEGECINNLLDSYEFEELFHAVRYDIDDYIIHSNKISNEQIEYAFGKFVNKSIEVISILLRSFFISMSFTQENDMYFMKKSIESYYKSFIESSISFLENEPDRFVKMLKRFLK